MDLKIKRYIAIFAQIIDLPRMKTIVTVFGWAEMGKTSALKCLAEQFGCEFTTSPWDIFQMFDYNGHLIGIASEGDPGSCQKDNIYKMIEAGCEVIVCASRTKGRTTENVDSHPSYLTTQQNPTQVYLIATPGSDQSCSSYFGANGRIAGYNARRKNRYAGYYL